MAMMFSVGCQAVCKIFLVKSKLSTLMSSFLLLPPTQTLRGLRTARGLLLSREASRVTSRFVFRSNILKKLLYAPVMITLKGNKHILWNGAANPYQSLKQDSNYLPQKLKRSQLLIHITLIFFIFYNHFEILFYYYCSLSQLSLVVPLSFLAWCIDSY